MPRIINTDKPEINWRKMAHIRPLVEKDSISLDLKKTDKELPRVTVITAVTDPVLFQFSLYSWRSVMYPPELLNWIILDHKKIINEEILGNAHSDHRVRVITSKFKNFKEAVMHATKMQWVYPEGIVIDDEKAEKVVSNLRQHVFTLLGCGDVWFEDTLTIKFRALVQDDYDCVIADTLAYYSPLHNSSSAHKLFLKYPQGGIYWKGNWWKARQGKMIGIPYIGNAVTIGTPPLETMRVEASVRFFDNFPETVKVMIRKMMTYVKTHAYDDFDTESDEE